jgi:hypothetical protein
MDEAGAEDTPRLYYDEAARAEIKQHLERVLALRKIGCEIDWGALWYELELAGWVYDQSVEETLVIKGCSPSDAIERLAECGRLIDVLIRKLNNRALFNGNFISDSKDPWCRSFQRETPIFGGLIEQLTAARNKVMARAKDLQEFTVEQKIRAYREDDCVSRSAGVCWVSRLVTAEGHSSRFCGWR